EPNDERRPSAYTLVAVPPISFRAYDVNSGESPVRAVHVPATSSHTRPSPTANTVLPAMNTSRSAGVVTGPTSRLETFQRRATLVPTIQTLVAAEPQTPIRSAVVPDETGFHAV